MMENIGTLRLMRSHLQAVRINDGAVIDKQNGTGVMFERFTHSRNMPLAWDSESSPNILGTQYV